MECKDYLQIIVLVATIISSNWLVSRQIKKNKKSGWIEDFRKEVASFTSIGLAIKPKSSKAELSELIRSSTLLILLLDEKDEKQEKLISTIAETTIMLSNDMTENHIVDFKSKHNKIIFSAKEIIREQTKRL
jgi:hypothetical protein